MDLQDRGMNEGDLSLILQNVTFGDAGMYSCSVLITQRSRTKRAVETIAIFKLIVVPRDLTGGK